ncbi:MAG TPA: DUF1579 domain-containing protein [Chitinophagaceae bacterium]|nr:DUF1579 domain-containing protein [Chitinophagaceae bacterium]
MKKITLMICAAAFLFAACDSKKEDKKTGESKETTNEAKTEKAWIPVDSAMMDKYWKENMTIGDQHKMLAKSAGTWTGDMTMWMADGDAPQKMPTTTETKVIYGGLYVQSTHTGTMMGMPFEGMSVMGYDNMKKEFFSTWIDNMGSGIMVSTGQWDEASKKLTLTATTKCMNGQDATIREVFTMIDDNNQMLEMYGPDAKTGKEFKTMEIKYTRKK